MKKVTHAGMNFGSKLEAAVYDILLLRERAGELAEIKTQQHVYLTAARIDYIADFSFWCHRTNAQVWCEAKGIETPVWRIKRRLYKHYGPGALEVWQGNYRKPFLKETIVPGNP